MQLLRHLTELHLDKDLVEFFWTMLDAQGVRADSLTALPILWVSITVLTAKTPE